MRSQITQKNFKFSSSSANSWPTYAIMIARKASSHSFRSLVYCVLLPILLTNFWLHSQSAISIENPCYLVCWIPMALYDLHIDVCFIRHLSTSLLDTLNVMDAVGAIMLSPSLRMLIPVFFTTCELQFKSRESMLCTIQNEYSEKEKKVERIKVTTLMHMISSCQMHSHRQVSISFLLYTTQDLLASQAWQCDLISPYDKRVDCDCRSFLQLIYSSDRGYWTSILWKIHGLSNLDTRLFHLSGRCSMSVNQREEAHWHVL